MAALLGGLGDRSAGVRKAYAGALGQLARVSGGRGNERRIERRVETCHFLCLKSIYVAICDMSIHEMKHPIAWHMCYIRVSSTPSCVVTVFTVSACVSDSTCRVPS